MSKAKEYWNTMNESPILDPLISDLKIMNHKTLEDVEELLPNIHDPIYKMTTQPTIDNWKAYAIDCKLGIDKLKTLKL